MTPSYWVLLIILFVVACWFVALISEVADGTAEERKVYAAKRAQQDAEDLLRGEKL